MERKPSARAAPSSGVQALALPLPRVRDNQTWWGSGQWPPGITPSWPPSLLNCLIPLCLSPHPLTSRPKTRRAPLRGSFGYPGGGNPRQIGRRRRSAAMLLTFCSSSRHRRRRRHRLESHHLLSFLLLLCLEALFSAAGERSAMSGKFREGLDGATLAGLCRRPRAALCIR